MSDGKQSLVRKYKETAQENKQQQDLRQKHNVADEGVYIVEKSNTFKFLLRGMFTVLRIVVSAVFVILAAVGLICLIYPDTRNALIGVWNGIIDNLLHLISNAP